MDFNFSDRSSRSIFMSNSWDITKEVKANVIVTDPERVMVWR